MRRSLCVLPLVLLFASASCSSPDTSPTGGGAESGAAGVGTGGTLGGSGGSSVVGGGGSGATTGGVSSGGSAGASSGGVAGTTAGTGAGGSGAVATGGSGGAGNGGGVGGGGTNPGGAGSGGGVNGGSAGKGGGAGQGGNGGQAGGGRSGSGGSGGGGGGTAGFNPCPATGPCKILPLGDSITDGLGVPGGGSYRIELFRLALAAGEQITYVGGSMNGPTTVDGQPFPRSHEGHSGWTIAQIDGIVPSPALTPDPHIILLHIGTNDMSNASGAPARLTTLIDQIIADLPNSLLVVAKIIPLSGSGAVTTFNNALPAIVDARAGMGKHVILVDQFTGFPTSELADGVHPNAAGYARMARVWYAAISGYIH